MQQKITWISFFLIGVVISILACVKVEPVQKATYVYTNGLPDPVKFRLNLSTINSIWWEATIKTGDSLVFNVTGSPGAAPFKNESSKRSGEIVELTFKNNKCTQYVMGNLNGTAKSGVFDLTQYQNYSATTIREDAYTLHYLISDIDKAKAVSCQ